MAREPYTLGLDLGSTSIGWVCLATDTGGQPQGIIDGGVRIFPKAVEDQTPTPKNVQRRLKRLGRRLIQRRARRKRKLENLLVRKGLLPPDILSGDGRETRLNALGDPYVLRRKALDEALAPYELGRCLLHLAQRRGFLSNRKTLLGELVDDPDAADLIEELDGDAGADLDREESKFKQDIQAVDAQIRNSGARTLGEYLAGFERDRCKRNRKHAGGFLRTSRQMYRDELAMIRKVQEPHHADRLSGADWDLVELIIFRQRPIKLRSDRVGMCELEPRRPRARVARLEYQRFRYLQDVNNLAYFEGDHGGYVPLTEYQRKALLEALETRPELSWAQVRKVAGLARSQRFNLELSEVKILKGNRTACAIRNVVGDAWDSLPTTRQLALVEDLLTIQNRQALKKRLVSHWGFAPADAVRLAITNFEVGHGSLSVKAISRLLPALEAGAKYSDAVTIAGYKAPLQQPSVRLDILPRPPETRNPAVNKALNELRKLVNAVIRSHGKPAAIRVEMARDLKMGKKRLAAFNRQQAANNKANREAEEAFGELFPSARPSRNDLLKYRLWRDQNSQCAYSASNVTISLAELFSDAVEVDHIYPFRRSLDDSYLNKVVCRVEENRAKGKRSPWEAFGSDTARWEQIVQRCRSWAKTNRAMRPKIVRILDRRDYDEIESSITTQLVDTRYISRIALQYLMTLGTDVTVVKGQITAWLRSRWELNHLLGPGPGKNRSDHRHHLIDALVVGLTDRRLYRRIAKLAQRRDVDGLRHIRLDQPWKTFARDARRLVERVIVSHVPRWRIEGALHEDTASGLRIQEDGTVRTVYRKLLNAQFTPKDAANIVDDTVRNVVVSYLDHCGRDPKRAFSEGFSLLHPNGTRIRRVRIYRARYKNLSELEQAAYPVLGRDGRPFRYMTFGNTHHVEIFRHRTKQDKYAARFVTMMEATWRARGVRGPKRPILNTFLDESHEFVEAFASGDMVRLNDGRLWRVQKLEKNNNRLVLRLHTDATTERNDSCLEKAVSTLFKQYNMKKVHVNRLGRVFDDQADR